MASSPRNLYKFLSFGDRLLQQLCLGEAYYADPGSFNDPLDCQPTVIPDIPDGELKQLLARMIIQRAEKELDVAMRRLRLKGERAAERRQALTQSEVEAILGNIEYQATDPEVEDAVAYIRFALTEAIEIELKRGYDTGVLCLSARYDSPLMWSHYAQQHRGVCLEYDVSQQKSELHKVTYGQSREVRASAIRDWLSTNDAGARRAIDGACLLTKARQWSYEREWRMLGPVGLVSAPARVKSIIFGMRCPSAVRYTIVRALETAKPKIKFWEIAASSSSFDLKRVALDVDELWAGLPRPSAVVDFQMLKL